MTGGERAPALDGRSAGKGAPGQGTPFRADIQGLRAVAILLVVLYHANSPVTGGYVGVDVFFVISGFLITRQLADELMSRHRVSFVGFYARRARRILPAATVTIIATVVVARVVLSPEAAHRSFVDAFAAVFYGANFRFAIEGANYLNSTLPLSPLLHFWSLGVEEQFYLLWPVVLVLSSLVWLAPRHGSTDGGHFARRGTGAGRRTPSLRLVCAVLGLIMVASFVVCVSLTTSSPSWAYYSIFSRAWELAAGSLVALAQPLLGRLEQRSAAVLSWLGLVAIAWASLSFNARTAFPGTAALVPVGGAVAVVIGGGVASESWGAVRLLRTRPFQWLGAVSYSWYLWHWPVLFFAPYVLGHSLSALGTAAAVVVSLGLATLSYLVVEQPLRKAKPFVRRPRLALAGAVPLVGLSLAAISASSFTLPVLEGAGVAARPALGPSGELTAAQLEKDLRSAQKPRALPVNLTPTLSAAPEAQAQIVKNGCSLQRTGTESKPCAFGGPSTKVTVALFGDSHAAQWFPALEAISSEQHWRLVDFTKSACPPVQVTIAAYPQCSTWRASAEAQIAALDPTLVVVSWARLDEPTALRSPTTTSGTTSWGEGAEATFAFLRSHSQHVLFISDTPTMSEDVPDCLSGHLGDAAACATPRGKALQLPTIKQEDAAAAADEGAEVLDPTSWFCTRTECPAVVGNIVVYRDDAHMTPEYSRFLAPVLAKAVVPVIDK